MKPRSAKNKGKRLQNAVRDMILENFTQLEPDDVVSTLMGDSGTDIKLSPAARKLFPYSPECKNQEEFNKVMEIAKADEVPIVIVGNQILVHVKSESKKFKKYVAISKM